MRDVPLLISDQSLDGRFELKRLAQKGGAIIAGEVGLGTEAVTTAAEVKPSVILVGMTKPIERATQTIESFLEVLPETPVIAYGWEQDVDIVRRAMLAGARDFIVMPVDEWRLAEVVRSVLASQDRRRERESSEATPKSPRGFVVSVFAAKGGVGKTTLATNVAVALSSRDGDTVALIDGDDGFGDVAGMLDLEPGHDLVEFLQRSGEEGPAEITDLMVRHSSGVYVLPAPAQPLNWRSISADDIQRVVSLIARRFDIVIIDTGGVLTDITLAILKQSDLVLWITSPDYASVSNSIAGLDALGQLSYPKERIRTVLNMVSPDSRTATERIESALGVTLWWQIPYDPELRSGSQAGQPAVAAAAKSRGAESIRGLAQTLVGETPAAPEAKASPLQRLMHWRPRTTQPEA
jgi:pilus assembly protein CpaE